MEYNEQNEQVNRLNLIEMMLLSTTERLNEQSLAIAALRAQVDALSARFDDSEHLTSEEYGNQVVRQIMDQMPAIQRAAMKQTKSGKR